MIPLPTLDGHYSHSRNAEVIDCVQENGAHNVFLPPHSTNKLQPLKTYYAQEIGIWLKNHSELLNTIKLLDWLGKLT